VSPAPTATPASSAAPADELAQLVEREALLEHEAGGERERHRPGHGEVVHGPVHRELADVSAGEPERTDDVGVGRDREPHPVRPDDRGVSERLEQRVPQLLEKEPLDEPP